jgi:general secretion pathway protein D
MPKVSLKVSAPATVKKNEQFAVDVMISDAVNLSTTPLTLVFDTSALEAVSVTEGTFLNQGSHKTSFIDKIDNQSGQLSVKITRDGTEGVSGEGKLFSARFKAKAAGPASIGFVGVKMIDAGGKQQDSILYNAVVEIKQP